MGEFPHPYAPVTWVRSNGPRCEGLVITSYTLVLQGVN
jgi:hypothetical protein